MMDPKYLNIVDKILTKINQYGINLFQINNKDFYLKIKINDLYNKNLGNLKNEDNSNKDNSRKKILPKVDDIEVSNIKINNIKEKVNVQEKIEDGYKVVFYEEDGQKYADIISTLVGKFYLTNNKDLKITKGTVVKANTILGYIEILNISYYIKLSVDTEVIEIYAENLPFVQYSSKILKLKILQ